MRVWEGVRGVCKGGEGGPERGRGEGGPERTTERWVGCRVGASLAHRASHAGVDAELLEHHVPVLRVGAKGDAARLRSVGGRRARGRQRIIRG